MAVPNLNPIRVGIERKIRQAVDALLIRAEEAAIKSEQSMLKTLSTKIPTDSPPDFAEFTTSKWTPKKDDGPFYYATGTMKNQQLPEYPFSRLQTSLGRPVALFKVGSATIMRAKNKSGLSVRASSGAALLGAERTEILDKVRSGGRFTLVVDPYPKLNSLARGAVERQVFGHDRSRGSLYHKLRNYNGEVWRPLLGSFMAWYKSYRISNAVARAVRGSRI